MTGTTHNRYGPQTAQVEALLKRARTLTGNEAQALAAAWDAARDVDCGGRDAVSALVVRDLIGQHGFTQEHYDTLVWPWESVMGTDWTQDTDQ